MSVENNDTIHKIYENTTFFDNYGNSVFMFIGVMVAFVLIASYSYARVNAENIKDDWANQRCKPTVMPFAGFINKPDNMSYNDFTKQNFEYCLQNNLASMFGFAIQPITYILSALTTFSSSLQTSINSSREVIDNMRNSFGDISSEIMGRSLNTAIPIEVITIKIKDFFAKIQGSITASLYTVLGSYYSLKTLMGAIAQLILTILCAMVAMIAIFWLTPFTWGTASALSSLFVAISIPFAVILVFMADVLHVKVSGGIPSLPKMKCFDGNTLVRLNNGSFKKIKDLNAFSDILYKNNAVTATLKLDTKDVKMYRLGDIIVSGSHLVAYDGNNGSVWINVEKHPDAVRLHNYTEKYIYCINTTYKMFCVGNHTFTDWDELKDDTLYKVLRTIELSQGIQRATNKLIHPLLDGGFTGDTLAEMHDGTFSAMCNIQIGDILRDGSQVYGIVQIRAEDLENNIIVEIEPNVKCSLNVLKNIDIMIPSVKMEKNGELLLYHILTDTGKFILQRSKDRDCCITYNDYNYLIDCHL